MFSFMDYGMPTFSGNNSGRGNMRTSARPSHRRLDTFDFFNPEPEPVYYYQPRQSVATSRHRPLHFYNNNDDYSDEEYMRYEPQRRAPRASLGGCGEPRHYRNIQEEELEEALPQTVPAARYIARPPQKQKQRQPESYKPAHQSRATRKYNNDDEEQHEAHRPAVNAKRSQLNSSEPSDSFWNQLNSEAFRGAQTTRSRPEATTFRSQVDEQVSLKASNKRQADIPKTQNNTSHKTAQSKPEQFKRPSKTSSKSNNVNKPVNHQSVTPKIVIKQDKGDLVVIEDVTPPQPKKNPALEPAKGLIIEEANPSQI